MVLHQDNLGTRMPKKRKLDPQSVWDAGALEQAFEEANIKKVHVTKLYKCVPTASYILGCRLDWRLP